ncbi:MAG: hypothetical protein IPJ16_06825 [Bacteroidales bacterium]|nr:hypothetical protein [Bacteroidales bacterium]
MVAVFSISVGKFLNKYRISSARLQNWDYGSNAPYYVTICAANREFFFGTIRNGEMHFSEIGEIVLNEWLKTPVIRPDMNIYLDEFVLMPNHFHGIILIGNNEFNNRLMNVENHNVCRAALVSTGSTIPTSTSKTNLGRRLKTCHL